MHKQQSKNPKGKNTYMYMNELKELERKTNSSMEFNIYLWNPKYWFLELNFFEFTEPKTQQYIYTNKGTKKILK